MLRLPPFLGLLAVLVVSASTATAGTTQPGQSLKPILWPDSTCPALGYAIRKVPFDGVDILVGQITGPGIFWETKLPAAWRPTKDSNGHSLVFVPQNGLPLRLELSIFGPTEFLPEISDAVWQRYLAGLPSAHNDHCDILGQVSATDPLAQWIPVLGAQTRTLTIRYLDAKEQPQVEIQCFAFCKDRLVVFVLAGPEKVALANAPLFYEALRHINAQHSP